MPRYLAAALAALVALACVNVATAGAGIQAIDAKLTPTKATTKQKCKQKK